MYQIQLCIIRFFSTDAYFQTYTYKIITYSNNKNENISTVNGLVVLTFLMSERSYISQVADIVPSDMYSAFIYIM